MLFKEKMQWKENYCHDFTFKIKLKLLTGMQNAMKIKNRGALVPV